MINTAKVVFYCNTKLYREAQFRKKRYATRNKSSFSFNWIFRKLQFWREFGESSTDAY